MSDLGLSGKRVIVTGAAGGLGRGFAQGFAKAGAKVLVADINEEGAAQTAEDINDTGSDAYSSKVDVTNAASCQALADVAQAKLGGLDILVNNAAIYAGLERQNFEDLDETVWDKVMSVNVKGVWQMCRAMTPHLKASGAGAIINVASATVFL